MRYEHPPKQVTHRISSSAARHFNFLASGGAPNSRRRFGVDFAPAYEQALERIRRMVRHSRTRKAGE
jgi:hypothetical protein